MQIVVLIFMRLVRLTVCTSTVFFNRVALLYEMPKYAVAKGKKPGIYDTWDECEKQVNGFHGAVYKKFSTLEQAEKYLDEHKVILIKSPGKVKMFTTEIKQHPVSKVKPSELSSCIMMNKSEAVPDYITMEPNKNISLFENNSMARRKIFTDIKRVPKVSPSDQKTNSFYQIVNSIEERLGTFINNMNDKWGKLETRLSAIEKQVFPSLNLQDSEQQGSSKRSASSEEEEESEQKHKIMKIETNDTVSDPSKIKLRSIFNGSCNGDQQNIDGNFILTDDGYVVVYTDGACSNNGKHGAKAGIGVWFNLHHELNVAEPVRGYATNNNAEIQAATKAITVAYGAGIRKLDIHTDSKFMINCITSWINKWKRNNWVLSNGGPVKNKEELIVLDNAIKKMEVVRWTHVRGHTGDLGNTQADELARRGAELYRTNVTYGQLSY